jgi:translation initiation factor eIF-2B subunit delta
MSAPAGDQPGAGPPAPASGETPKENKPQDTAPAEAPKKPTGAELKAQKAAEKAKRRAAAIAAKEAAAAGGGAATAKDQASQPGKSVGNEAKKGKPKERSASSSAPGGSKQAHNARQAAQGAKVAAPVAEVKKVEDPRSLIPEMFSHLSMARRISVREADHEVHPTVLAVGQQMAAFTLKDPMERLEATLHAFKKVRPLFMLSSHQV